jgi:stalled ribosome alternative rescue factor ArfA
MTKREGDMKKDRKLPRPRNPEARALESPLFRQRIVPNRKGYRRKGRRTSTETATEE